MLAAHRYTFLGIVAILLWSSLVALTRGVAENFGAVGGAALIYTVSSVMLFFTIGIPKLKLLSWRYLAIAGGLFAAYEVCFSLALGFANDRLQTIEMAVINYLWPSLTVLMAVVASKRKVSWLIYPSALIAFFGVTWCLMGDKGLSLEVFLSNVATNPVAYSLAFFGAILWAIYCNITKRLSNGQNGITLFFIFTAMALWIHYFKVDEPAFEFTISSTLHLLLTALVIGSGYALWNIAIIGGNMLFLATLSYFTPILSTLLSAVILGVAITATFWQGVALVTIGSLVCWWVTRDA